MHPNERSAVTESLPHKGDEPHLFREIIRTYQTLVSGFSSETGMPASRFAVVRAIAMSGRGIGVSDLARELEVNAAAVTRHVKELESEGLAKRQADPRDGRRSTITLSRKGRNLFEKAHDRAHVLERSLASELSHEELANTARVLERVRKALERRS